MNQLKSKISPFIRPCPICKNESGYQLDTIKFQTFDNSPISGDFSLAFCNNCGHIFYDNNLTEEQVNSFYIDIEYNSSNIRVGTGSQNKDDIIRQGEIIQRINKWFDTTEKGIIFDIGAGRGGLTKQLLEFGYKNVIAIELSANTVELIKKENLTAYVGSAQNLPKINISPSLAIYSHIFEHMLSPANALNEIKKVITHDGLVYIEVPDASYYPLEEPPFIFLYLAHLHHFTLSSLKNILILSGFEVLKIDRSKFYTFEKDGRYVPIVYAIGRLKNTKQTSQSALNQILPVRETIQEDVDKFLRYLEFSKNSPILKKIDKIAKSAQPLWIWGVTQLVQFFIGQNYISIKDIAGFIDKDTDKQRHSILGKPIHPIEILNNFTVKDTVLLVVPGVEDRMKSYLAEINFKGKVLTLLDT
ncbi:MAG: class I SAM-dependent methyltransferase [Deltaproteobacteria bacterium]|jgi:SAM-dependent methyltransferase|nr:class I SAM-dependent methyltransferase [Deltaproteobacteria bacterium]